MIRAAAALVVALGVRIAGADGPGIDIADLPPLPPEDAAASSATVMAAALVEDDLVVGAAKREQSLGSVASAVTVVSGDRIRRFGYRTVGEAVAGVAGLYLVDNRLSYSLGIRGLQIPGDFNTRLLVLVDGMTVNEAWGSFVGVGFEALVSVDDIARIEVIRGPVSSVYGTSAFFGTINIVTRDASETPRAWARTSINSVNGSITSAGFATGGVHRQLRGSLQIMDRIGDTTALDALPDTRLTGDGSSAITGALVAADDHSFAQLRAVRYGRQSPFAPYDADPTGTPYEQHDTQLVVEGGHTRELSNHLTIAARLYGNFYQFDDRSPAKGGSTLDTVGTAQVYGGELRGRYELSAPERFGITAGVEASYDRTQSSAHTEDGDPASSADVPLFFNVEGAYAELDLQPARWLGLTAGLRYDRRAVTTYRAVGSSVPTPRPETQPSPRLAVFFADPERRGVKLLYARGFRYPSAFEGYFEDGRDFERNPRIRAEQITSYEVVAWARPQTGLSLRLSGFHWTADHVIEQGPGEIDPDKLEFQSTQQYVSQGVEAEASYRDSRGWYAFGGFAFARVGVGNNADRIVYGHVPNAPAITASVGVSTPPVAGRVHASSEVTLVGERPTRGPPTSPAWIGWNAALHAPDLAGFDVTAGVRNVLGIRDLVPAPGDYDRTTNAAGMPAMIQVSRVPAEGREVYVKVGYSY